jgi:8-oxo-dGTP diphosphatase
MNRIEVAAAIFRRNGRIFLCRRGEGGSCAYLWEFPGGKLEKGETPEECLIRECREELKVGIEIDGLYDEFDYDYPDKSLRFYFYDARIISGEPELTVHSEAEWLWPRELTQYDACPADRELIEKLSHELPFDHYMWDFDGTLFDTYPRIASALKAAFEDFGHYAAYEEVLALTKRSVTYALDTLMEKFQTKASLEELKDHYRRHEGGYSKENAAPLYPGMKELLQEIVARGGKNYLYTHRGISSIKYLTGYSISHLFADSITGQDPYPPKPAPDAVLALIERHHMKKGRVVMVGDRDIDVLSAQNAGAFGCFFDPDQFFDDYPIELMAHSVEELRALLLGE